MPTKNPRVIVTLSHVMDATITRLSALERVSKSQLIREMLEAAEPTLVKTVAIMEAALKARSDSRKEFAENLEQSQSRIEGELDAVVQALSFHSRDLVSEAQAVRGRRPAARSASTSHRAAPSRQDPPPSNRGVKSPRKGV
jgi:hypothetical protein